MNRLIYYILNTGPKKNNALSGAAKVNLAKLTETDIEYKGVLHF